MKYAWARDQSGYPVRRLCRALNVSTSGYYAWRDRRPSSRAKANAQLLERIQALHVRSRQTYGAVRPWQALRREGETCGRHRVCRLLRKHGIQAKRQQRYMRTRGSYQRVPPAPNLLAWPFVSPKPDAVWVADITFVPTRAGWLYLAAILDLHTRQIVGWAMGEHADQALVSAALRMAVEHRKPAPGAIHHSDQGSQYTSGAYQTQLKAADPQPSMSRKGMPYDNAVAESFFSSLKQELTHHERFADLDEARQKLFDGYRTPVEQKQLASA